MRATGFTDRQHPDRHSAESALRDRDTLGTGHDDVVQRRPDSDSASVTA